MSGIRINWIKIQFWLVALIVGYAVIPVNNYIEINRLTVTDGFVDPSDPTTRIINVDRKLGPGLFHLGWFDASYTVTESLLIPNGRSTTIKACDGPIVRYKLDKELPNPLTIGWWAWGRCDRIPVYPTPIPEKSFFILCTRHRIYFIPFLPFSKTTAETCSYPYQRRAIPENFGAKLKVSNIRS